MARVLMSLIGLLLFALGVWTAILWWPAVKVLLMGVLVCLLLLFGLVLFIFGASEISGARRKQE